MRSRTHAYHRLGISRPRSPWRTAMGMGRSPRLCRHRQRAVVRGVAGRAWRAASRYPDDGEVWLLPAVPIARYVLPREKGMVCQPAAADTTDGGGGDRDHARGGSAIRAGIAGTFLRPYRVVAAVTCLRSARLVIRHAHGNLCEILSACRHGRFIGLGLITACLV